MTEHPYVAPHTSREVYVKGDFSTYPALICPLCNGYQGLSGNGAIKKRYSEREKEEERCGEKRKGEGRRGRKMKERKETQREGDGEGMGRVRKEGEIKDNGESKR